MKITSTQIDMLRSIVAGGGVITSPSPSASGTLRKIKSLESLGLLANRDHLVWEITPKGFSVSKLNVDGQPSESPIQEDGGITVENQHVLPGDEILIKGKRGKFRFKFASTTS